MFNSLRQERGRAQQTARGRCRRSGGGECRAQRLRSEPIGHEQYWKQRARALEDELGEECIDGEDPKGTYRQSRIREWHREMRERDELDEAERKADCDQPANGAQA